MEFLAARSFFVEQCLELFHHLVHRVDHPAKLRRARQVRRAEKLAAGDGIGLLDHVLQRAQLALEQQHAQADAHEADQRQPQERRVGVLPQLGDGEIRVADHLDMGRLIPAGTGMEYYRHVKIAGEDVVEEETLMEPDVTLTDSIPGYDEEARVQYTGGLTEATPDDMAE